MSKLKYIICFLSILFFCFFKWLREHIPLVISGEVDSFGISALDSLFWFCVEYLEKKIFKEEMNTSGIDLSNDSIDFILILIDICSYISLIPLFFFFFSFFKNKKQVSRK